MKKKLFYPIAILAMIIFIALPLPSSNLYIRIYFDETDGKMAGKRCILYYAADADDGYSREQCVSAAIDHEGSKVEFCLDASLENRIIGMRLDFPAVQQIICIKSITVSSAGVIKRQYDACDFFAEDNIVHADGIYAINPVAAKSCVYIGTLAEDPYVVLSNGLCGQIISCYSHFRLTRLAICLFLAGCHFLAKLKIFHGFPV